MKKTYKWLLMLCASLLAVCVVWVAVILVGEWHTKQTNNSLRDLYGAAQAEETVIQPDFEQLYAANPDVVGWLSVPDVCDLPVVMRDNSYYMARDYYGREDNAGTLFADERNTLWPADQNVLIYGHNMRSGEMFGLLKEYRSLDFLKSHPIIEFRTIYDEEPTAYVPFAVFDASMSIGDAYYFPLIRMTFTDEEWSSFSDELASWSLFATGDSLQPGDKLITLVTCSYTNNDGRLMVFARALREGETREDAQSMLQAASVK